MKISFGTQYIKGCNFDIIYFGFFNGNQLFSINFTIMGITLDIDFHKRIRCKK